MRHIFIINPAAGKKDGRQRVYTMAEALKKNHDLDIECMLTKSRGHAMMLTRAIAETGVRSIQLHTGGMCHLDAAMTREGLQQLGTQGLDLVILENVGNLVCPAEFDTGAHLNLMILSVPEGHDKPLKYPLIFQTCGAMIVNKIDVLPYFDFDLDKVTEFARRRNPDLEIFPISAKTGEGVEALADWLCSRIRTHKEKKKETNA